MKTWFEVSFRKPDKGNDSAISEMMKSGDKIVSGTYLNGLLTVLTAEDSKKMLLSWEMALGKVVCLLITGLGDAFFWSIQNQAVYFLDAQVGTYVFVDRDVEWFLFDYLKISGVREEVLHESTFRKVLRTNKQLEYGEIFFPVPFLIISTPVRIDSYQCGDAETYFALLAQMIGMENVKNGDL